MKPIIVRFNSPSEFIQELQAGATADSVEPVLRVTRMFRASPLSPAIQRVSIVATHLRRFGNLAQIITLDAYCGEDWGKDLPDSETTRLSGDKIMAHLETCAKELGLHVRAGIYKPTP